MINLIKKLTKNFNESMLNQKHFQKLYNLPYNNFETFHFQMLWNCKAVSFNSTLHQTGPLLEIIIKMAASAEKNQQPHSLNQDNKQWQVFLNFRRTWRMLTHIHSTVYKRCKSRALVLQGLSCKGKWSYINRWHKQGVETFRVNSVS